MAKANKAKHIFSWADALAIIFFKIESCLLKSSGKMRKALVWAALEVLLCISQEQLFSPARSTLLAAHNLVEWLGE